MESSQFKVQCVEKLEILISVWDQVLLLFSFFFMCSLLPEDFHSELILSSLQLVLCHVAAVKRLPVHHHSADYIFSGPLGSLCSF